MVDLQPLLTPAELARLLGCKEPTLAVWRSSGIGPAYIKIGNRVRYVREQVEEWMMAGPGRRRELEEAAECHAPKRRKGKRLRGRDGAALRERQLREEPHCRDCRDAGEQRVAVEVDHILRLEDGGTNDPENLRSLCKSCHRARTRERWTKKP